MADTSFDIIIIGSGPGGYVTAIRAAQLGYKTAIVEKSYLGGICLNWGCIPTKALLRSAEIFHYMQHAKDYGLSAENVSFDAKAVVQRSRGVSKRLNDGVGFLMKKNKITVIWGEATIDAPGKITVKGGSADAPKGVLGAGCRGQRRHGRRERELVGAACVDAAQQRVDQLVDHVVAVACADQRPHRDVVVRAKQRCAGVAVVAVVRAGDAHQRAGRDRFEASADGEGGPGR